MKPTLSTVRYPLLYSAVYTNCVHITSVHICLPYTSVEELLLVQDPSKRWSCEQLLMHPFFKSFSFKLPEEEEVLQINCLPGLRCSKTMSKAHGNRIMYIFLIDLFKFFYCKSWKLSWSWDFELPCTTLCLRVYPGLGQRLPGHDHWHLSDNARYRQELYI